MVGDLKKNESVYFFLKGHPRYFNRINSSSAYLNENESLFEINVVADGMKRLDQEELEAGGKNQIITIKDSKYQIPLGELNLITRLIYEYVNKKSFAASGLKYANFKYKADEGKLFIYLDGSYCNVNMFLQKIYA